MTTYIVFVLDETGSMSSVKDDTIGGFNTYIEDLERELKDVNFSLMKFDSTHKTWVYKGVETKYVKPLNENTYTPGAWTPLWDAFASGIHRAEEQDIKEGDKVIISVLTDGQENDSKEFTREDVKALIAKHPDWAINFLGANMDAWDDVGRGLGMSIGSTLTFDQSDMVGTFNAVSRSTVAYAKGETTVDTFYKESDTVESTQKQA